MQAPESLVSEGRRRILAGASSGAGDAASAAASSPLRLL